MKNNSIPKAAIFCLVIGLLLTSSAPILNRYLPVPELMKGFSIGLGLALEVIALVKIDRAKKAGTSAARCK